jgi:hypothetical protein
MTRVIASLLYMASLDLPMPEFHRHYLARLHLMKTMRHHERSWRDSLR